MDLITPGYGLIFWQIGGFVYIGFWFYAILNLVNSEFTEPNTKLIWALIILLTPFGSFLYLLNSRRGKKRGFRPDFSKISKPKNL